jgi:predicted nucleotidyltransferase
MPFRPSPSEALLLEEFRRRLLLAAPGEVAALRVFGSRARGASDAHSDLDVAVEPVPGAERQRLQRAAVAAAWDAMEALRLEELMLSPVVVPMDGDGLAAVIAQEGALVWREDAT